MKWGIMAMKSKTSFFNRGVLLNDFKRFAWIGAGYLLVLLLSVPLKVFMLYSNLEYVSLIPACHFYMSCLSSWSP